MAPATNMQTTGSTFSSRYAPTNKRQQQKNMTFTSPSTFNPSAVRYDTEVLEGGLLASVYSSAASAADTQTQQELNTVDLTNQVGGSLGNTTTTMPKMNQNTTTGTDPLQREIEQIRGYLDMLDQYSLHNFIIWRGRTVTDTPEFSSFKRKYDTFWGSVLSVVGRLEELCLVYEIQMCVVDGAKCAELAACDAPGVDEDEVRCSEP